MVAYTLNKDITLPVTLDQGEIHFVKSAASVHGNRFEFVVTDQNGIPFNLTVKSNFQVANEVKFVPTVDITSTDVQAAIEEVFSDSLQGFNLSASATPTNVTVNNPTGNNAVIPLATTVNAGALSPADKVKIDNAVSQTAATVPSTVAGNLSSTDVQAALEELDTEKASLTGANFTGQINNTGSIKTLNYIEINAWDGDANGFGSGKAQIWFDASAPTKRLKMDTSVEDIEIDNGKLLLKENAAGVPFTPASGLTSTDVQSAIVEASAITSTFLGLTDVTPSTFSGKAKQNVRVNPAATGIEFFADPIYIGGYTKDVTTSNEIVFGHLAATSFTIPDNFSGSKAYLDSNPTAGAQTFNINKNNVVVGSLSIDATGSVTFNTTGGTVSVVSGDRITASVNVPQSGAEGIYITMKVDR